MGEDARRGDLVHSSEYMFLFAEILFLHRLPSKQRQAKTERTKGRKTKPQSHEISFARNTGWPDLIPGPFFLEKVLICWFPFKTAPKRRYQLLSCSLEPIFPFFGVAAPLRRVFPKKGSAFFPRVTEQLRLAPMFLPPRALLEASDAGPQAHQGGRGLPHQERGRRDPRLGVRCALDPCDRREQRRPPVFFGCDSPGSCFCLRVSPKKKSPCCSVSPLVHVCSGGAPN